MYARHVDTVSVRLNIALVLWIDHEVACELGQSKYLLRDSEVACRAPHPGIVLQIPATLFIDIPYNTVYASVIVSGRGMRGTLTPVNFTVATWALESVMRQGHHCVQRVIDRSRLVVPSALHLV